MKVSVRLPGGIDIIWIVEREGKGGKVLFFVFVFVQRVVQH